MRRFLSVVLMLVLVLQATWSAAAEVCRHEPTTAEAHFGHHVHLDAHEPAQAENGPQVPHLDCVGCHGGMCAALLGWPAALPTGLPDLRHATPYQRSITDGLPERLIRPPHRFLA
ncbi:hypothetical protein [Pseudorhodoferax soli]|uniref:Cobalt-zinc-cadmium efflux system protein n=1 Tax=Pseudorhodoferax soli TaxID=545864 RepID=A0A368Y6H5_9BURK|nr:hypothetical protein [Pseudorhodoferax soli]RCW75695.1 hypothetical protein DES41_101290 [Pseudorhodoferax soli]